MEKTVYTAALIGCGRIGYSLGLDRKREQPASHTMALNGNDRIKLIAGCDTDVEKLEEWHAANKGCAVFSSTDEMYEKILEQRKKDQEEALKSMEG